MKKICFLSCALLVASCAGPDKEHRTLVSEKHDDKNLIISFEKRDGLSTKNLLMFDFTLRNETDDFQRYRSISLEFNDDIKDKVKIVVGQDLVDWGEGVNNRAKLAQHNLKWVTTALMATGATLAATSNKENLRNAGLISFASGAGVLTMNDFTKERERATRIDNFELKGVIPESHLLYNPLSVPPGLFTHKFILFHVTNDILKNFYEFKIVFEKEDGTKFTRLAKFSDIPIEKRAVCDEEVEKPIFFKGQKVMCKNQCLKFHPLDQKPCEANFR